MSEYRETDKQLTDRWKYFFGEQNAKSTTIKTSKHGIQIAFNDLHLLDDTLENALVHDPINTLRLGETYTQSAFNPPNGKRVTRGRIMLSHLPSTFKKAISDLKSDDIHRLIVIEGFVVEKSPIEPKLDIATFQCTRCGAITKIQQREDTVKKPEICSKENGGCGRNETLELLREKSTFVDTQKILIEERVKPDLPEEKPQILSVQLEGEMCNVFSRWDRVILNGILKVSPGKRKDSRLFSMYLDALSIEEHEKFEEHLPKALSNGFPILEAHRLITDIIHEQITLHEIATNENIIAEGKKRGLSEEDIKKILRHMHETGKLYTPRGIDNGYRLTAE